MSFEEADRDAFVPGVRVLHTGARHYGREGVVVEKKAEYGFALRAYAVLIDGEIEPIRCYYHNLLRYVKRRRQKVECEGCGETCKRRNLCWHCGRLVCGYCWNHACRCEPGHTPAECRDLARFKRYGLSFINRCRAMNIFSRLQPLRKVTIPKLNTRSKTPLSQKPTKRKAHENWRRNHPIQRSCHPSLAL